MRFTMLLLFGAVFVQAQTPTYVPDFDKEAIDTYKDWLDTAENWLPTQGDWTDNKTCNFINAYENLETVEKYAAKHRDTLEPKGITVDSVRKLRIRFVGPLMLNLKDRIQLKKPLKRDCGVEVDEIGGLLKVDASVPMRTVANMEKYLKSLEKDYQVFQVLP